MGKKVKKILKTILCGIGLIALLILSAIAGMRVERSNQRELEMQKVHVASIAVVNMDNGVLVGDEHVNYASQLMSFPSEHFTVTGLTDAKAGIANGSYAAYIVVPETFSSSVTSIEFAPQKVTLGCQYNAKLDEESQIQAMSDVNAFIALLNSNTAYMYLDAILAEFHQIQDDSSTILANDNAELELLASVNAEQLIAVAEPVDEIFVEDDIQPVQLETYTTQNHALLDSMMYGYTDAVQEGKDDYAVIKANNSQVGQAADNFFSTYDSVIQDTTSEHAALLETGREKLDAAVGEYNLDVEAQSGKVEEAIVNLINLQLENDQAAADYQLTDIVNDMKNKSSEKLMALQKRWERVYKSLQSKADRSLDKKLDSCKVDLKTLVKDIYMQGYNNALNNLDEQMGSMKDAVGSSSDAVTICEIQDIINQMKLTDVPQSDIESFDESIESLLSNIVIKWDELGIVLPPIYGSSGGETNLGDGVCTEEEPDLGDGDGTGEDPDSGSGDDTGEDPDPGDGGGTGEDPDLGDGDGTGEDPDQGDEDSTGEDPDPGDGEGTGENPDSGDGDGTGDGDDMGEDPDPDDGDGMGEDPDPDDGEGTGEDPDPDDGEGTGEDPDPGDGEGAGEDPDPDDGDGTGEDPDPGDGDGTGEKPDPDDGDDTGEEPDPDDGDDTWEEPDPDDDKEYKISLAVFESNQEVISTAVTDTLQLFKLEPQIEEIGNVIQTCFVDALSEESQRQMSRLTDAGQQLNQSIESYESSLMSYDPMKYIENADLNTYLSGIESNTGEMMNTVEQNNTEYMLYAADMYSTTTEHTTELRSSLDEANSKTTANVENCINDLVSSRKTVNSINVDMLKGFTELLNYTRVESQGNTEVYDHIVNPVTSRVNGQAAADTPAAATEKGISAKVWIILILSVGILLCMTEILNVIRRQLRKPAEEREEVL